MTSYSIESQLFIDKHLFFNHLVQPSGTGIVSTETPFQPTSCRNDGVLINGTDGISFCYCQPLYTGVDCGTQLCMNGGSPINSIMCRCPDGYTGNLCENGIVIRLLFSFNSFFVLFTVTCTPLSGTGFGTDRPRPTFVIRTKHTMSNTILQIADAIVNITNALTFDPQYLQNYGLVLFSNNRQLCLI